MRISARPCSLLLLGLILAGGARAVDEAGGGHPGLEQAAFVREGIGRLFHPQFQYACIGLGGTTVRVGPYGFTRPGAPRVMPGGYLQHLPYLAYEYWWDEDAHRHLPFDLVGGYGDTIEPGQVTGYREHLDIRTGLLTLDLDLRTDPAWEGLYRIGRNAFHSRRELFVTPDGVLVVRVTDSPEAVSPFRVRVHLNRQVRIYLNQGVYAGEHAPWEGTAALREAGLVVTAERPRSCTATLALAVETAEPEIDAEEMRAGRARGAGVVTFYLAPGSSYADADPEAAAWGRADRARSQGYERLRRTTAEWWEQWYDRSSVTVPDPELMRWYLRSLYYHGVYFGNTRIPPGCNGTSIESFAGAVCCEYDLPFSQFALLYTHHLDAARGVADWVTGVLPRAEDYAGRGLEAHGTRVRYTGGAKYPTLMGWDGTALLMPTPGEGLNVYSNYPGANAAAMALAYADWTGDRAFRPLAERVLRGTTRVSVEDLDRREDLGGYLSRNVGNTVQQSAAIFGVREALARGCADPGWDGLASRIVLPTAGFEGKEVITAGPGAVPFPGFGDACWLQGLWWYGFLEPADPRVVATYEMIARSMTGNYVFNNAWMGVYAAKLGRGREARDWLHRMIRPGVTVFDDTCFAEIVVDPEDFKKTPEAAAHAALVCGVVQMLLDPDDDRRITVFPAVPGEWEQAGFRELLARGGIAVSAERDPERVRVTLENRGAEPVTRDLRMPGPRGLRDPLEDLPPGAHADDGWCVIRGITLEPGQSVSITIPAALPPPAQP